ncbi:MAG: NAD-dependent epimerase/dehydratase family protein [Elusimicrobia bacterium]|nr:NAD-dependent epimerase/dehydratase family protein [Elusimicrobiota bacterium]
MAKKVLVTGCSGYLGELLVKDLLAHPIVQKVVAVDLKPPKLPARPHFKHCAADIRDEFLLRSIIEEESIDTIFHLAFLETDPSRAVLSHAVNVGGTLTVFDAANKSSSVNKLVITGSTWAYGARRRNPLFLDEGQPLTATDWPYGLHKRLVEEELRKSLPQARKNLNVVVLRFCTVVGGSERPQGPVRLFCEMPFGLSVMLRSGALQFLSESDFCRTMNRVMEEPSLSGTFNVAPDDYTTLSNLCRRLGKWRLPMPYGVLWLLFFLARRLNKDSIVSEDLANLLAFPVVVSNEKIKKALGLEFDKSSEDAFLECAASCGWQPVADAPAGRLPGTGRRTSRPNPHRTSHSPPPRGGE